MYKWAKQTRGWNEDFWSNILFNWPQIIPLTTTFPIIQKSEHNASQLNGFYMMGIFTSSRSEVFCKKGIITCFVKFTGHRPATLLKKRLWHSCFPVNFAKFFRTPFFKNTSGGCLWILVINRLKICHYFNNHEHCRI